MNNLLTKKITISLIIFVTGILIAIVILFLHSMSDMCKNYIHQVNLSPDEKYKAVVFQRDCGATTEFNTQISIVGANNELDNDSGNIYVIEGPPEKIAPAVIWQSNSKLVLKCALSGSEFKAVSEWGWFKKIQITYLENLE